jgi:hypothetical protein
MATHHRVRKLIEEAWEGGTKSFDAAFEKRPGQTFCQMIDRVVEKHGKGWAPECFKFYWKKLEPAEQEKLALVFCETVIAHEARLRALGENVD